MAPFIPGIRQFVTAACIVLGVLLASDELWAQVRASEPDLKAAIIINMTLFVDWPAPSSLPADKLAICFLRESPVATALAKSHGKILRNRPITVGKVRSDALGECHVVYLSANERGQLPGILDSLRNAPVLIAGDAPELFGQGTMLNLELSGGNVVFDIDLRAAQKAGLQISSKALRLARQVIE